MRGKEKAADILVCPLRVQGGSASVGYERDTSRRFGVVNDESFADRDGDEPAKRASTDGRPKRTRGAARLHYNVTTL